MQNNEAAQWLTAIQVARDWTPEEVDFVDLVFNASARAEGVL